MAELEKNMRNASVLSDTLSGETPRRHTALGRKINFQFTRGAGRNDSHGRPL
jgi:hypothetical protein